MRILTSLAAGVCALTLGAAVPATATDVDQETAQSIAGMPGDAGTNGSDIPINRGSGFVPLPDSTAKRGVVADASRPVTVSDQPASRVGRPVPQHRWGVFGNSRIRSSDRVYFYAGPRYRYGPRYGRVHRDKYDKPSGPTYSRLHPRQRQVQRIGSGAYVKSGNFSARIGF